MICNESHELQNIVAHKKNPTCGLPLCPEHTQDSRRHPIGCMSQDAWGSQLELVHPRGSGNMSKHLQSVCRACEGSMWMGCTPMFSSVSEGRNKKKFHSVSSSNSWNPISLQIESNDQFQEWLKSDRGCPESFQLILEKKKEIEDFTVELV